MYRTNGEAGCPAPILGAADEAVVHRVVDDVLDGCVVVLLGLDHLRPVAPAEEVVLAAVPPVEGPGVAPVQVPHALVDVGAGRLDQKVVVVPHQAADVHPPAVATLDPPQDVQEDHPVLVVAHDRHVVVPAGDHVVVGAGDDDSVRPSHSANVAAAEAIVPPREPSGTRPARPRHVPGMRRGTTGQGPEGLLVWD
jgi:hypothetical protein